MTDQEKEIISARLKKYSNLKYDLDVAKKMLVACDQTSPGIVFFRHNEQLYIHDDETRADFRALLKKYIERLEAEMEKI